jgi:hypothetical protein
MQEKFRGKSRGRTRSLLRQLNPGSRNGRINSGLMINAHKVLLRKPQENIS